jgi:plastocyanin
MNANVSSDALPSLVVRDGHSARNIRVWIAVLLSLSGLVFGQETNRARADSEKPAPESEVEGFGSVQGVVIFRGAVPKARIADDAGIHHELLEVDQATRGLGYVVAYLTSLNNTTNVQAASAAPSLPDKPRAILDQQNYTFVPRVLAVREGQEVLFMNSDSGNHNVRSASGTPKNEFNVFTGAGGKHEHRFVADAKHRPIRLGCDIHPWMQAWIYVFNQPHFAVTDKQGRFRIGFVPPGEYKLVLQQPDIRYTHERSVKVSSKATAKIDIEIRAEDLSQPR